MIYNTAHYWRDTNGMIWQSLSRVVPGAGTTDLTMGPVRACGHESLQMKAYREHLAWAQSHRMNIVDKVSAC